MGRTITCPHCSEETHLDRQRCERCNDPLPYDEESNIRYVSDVSTREVESNRRFTVNFKCENCHNEWEYGFKYGDSVNENVRHDGVTASIDQSAEYDAGDAPALNRSRIIYCQNCGEEFHIAITAREPAD